jgi:aminoglycoside phosphotransferase (APT) family kinase protein
MSETASADLRQRLQQFLSEQTNSAVTIHELHPIPGGASRETWAVDATIAEAGSQPLILRRDMGSSMNPEALSRAQEFALLRLAYEQGVMVPRVRWLCDGPEVLGAPFFVMDRIDGESIGARVVRKPELAHARSLLPQQMAEQLALIHRIDPALPALRDLPQPQPGQSPGQHALDSLRRHLAALDLHNPAVEWALRWLQRHLPVVPAQTLVHGDFRIGNLLVGEAGLRAVIDWEFAHLGDPHEDLAWPCVRDWRFGNDALRLGGIGDVAPLLAAYETASGRVVDRAALRWWEIMGNLRWAVTCLAQAQRHLSGSDPSVEFASLGRRAAEMELEYLLLIRAASEEVLCTTDQPLRS